MPTDASHPARFALVFVLLAALLVAACEGPSRRSGDVSLDTPDLTIDTYQGADVLGGEQVTLSQVVAQGKPVVVNFWAALCGPCVHEMPDFERVYQARRDQFTLVGVDIGPHRFLGTREEGRALLQDLEVTYPNGTTFDQDAVRDFEITAMPATFFFGSDGTLVRKWVGALTEDKMNQYIDELVGR